MSAANPRATAFCPSVPTVTIDCENDQLLQLSVCVVRPRAAGGDGDGASECEIDMRCATPTDDASTTEFTCNTGEVAAVASLPSSLETLILDGNPIQKIEFHPGLSNIGSL
ncbi:hypothetical protein ATCC90586_005963 [Pythium insidiosum]|nr:hypothetical protein ATCC90586_005962 [Pythium insidiosum]KAJ0411868.1 hypothetical protein ATCC90586_005963 [Pythium insidiosum]